MSDVVGLALRDGQVDVVAVRERLGARHLLTSFSVPADEETAAAIRRELQEAGVRARRARVALPRRVVVAKAIELPPVPGAGCCSEDEAVRPAATVTDFDGIVPPVSVVARTVYAPAETWSVQLPPRVVQRTAVPPPLGVAVTWPSIARPR